MVEEIEPLSDVVLHALRRVAPLTHTIGSLFIMCPMHRRPLPFNWLILVWREPRRRRLGHHNARDTRSHGRLVACVGLVVDGLNRSRLHMHFAQNHRHNGCIDGEDHIPFFSLLKRLETHRFTMTLLDIPSNLRVTIREETQARGVYPCGRAGSTTRLAQGLYQIRLMLRAGPSSTNKIELNLSTDQVPWRSR